MKSTITNAAEITILNVIDNTYKTGGGPVSIAGTVVMASKGPVGVVTKTYDSDWQDIFGKPLTKKSTGMEGLRHLQDATPEITYAQVVRVVADDAKFPTITFTFANDKGAWSAGDYVVGDVITITGDAQLRCISDVTTTEEPTASDEEWISWTDTYETLDAETYGTTLTLADTDMMYIIPTDGDPSTNRKVYIENVDTDTERFDIRVTDIDSLGEEYDLETITVGVDPDDKDDMGTPAYIEYRFENLSDYFEIEYNEDLPWATVVETLQAIENTTGTAQSFAFTGGTNGGDPTTENWTDAWDLFRNEHVTVNMLFAAGNYDADVLENISDIADERHIASFADVPPYLDGDAAMTWLSSAGIKSRHMRMYYLPFSASDKYRGGKTVWGASGAAVAAKAIGNANYTGATPGVHYAPAGPKRASLTRTGLKAYFPNDIIDRDAFYDARINPVIASDSGGAVIDDDLTLHFEQNYSRFGWVNDILDYINHRFIEAAGYAKFEPDGLTYNILYDLTKQIMDDLVTSGALVAPRNPDVDGTEPYVITITQEEIDLWLVQWDVCPTGAARRIAGQPRLIK